MFDSSYVCKMSSHPNPISSPTKQITIDVPWGQMAAECWGEDSGGGRVLMVHGLQHNACSFRALVPLLPSHLYYVCIDLPGHGFSSPFPPGVPLEFFHYVYSIKRFVDTLRWDRFILVGHSLGCMLSSIFASTFSERVEKFAAIDGLVPFVTKDSACVETLRKNLDDLMALERTVTGSTARKTHTREQVLQKIMNGPNGKVTEEVALAILHRSAREQPPGIFTFTDDPRLRLPLRPLMSKSQVTAFMQHLTSPTILVLSNQTLAKYKNDARIFAVNVVKILDAGVDSEDLALGVFKSGKLIQVEGDHFVHINNPQVVAKHINNFLLELQSSL